MLRPFNDIMAVVAALMSVQTPGVDLAGRQISSLRQVQQGAMLCRMQTMPRPVTVLSDTGR